MLMKTKKHILTVIGLIIGAIAGYTDWTFNIDQFYRSIFKFHRY